MKQNVKIFKAIFVIAIALFGINTVNAQISVTPSSFELSLGQSQEVSISGNMPIDGVFLDMDQSTNADYVGIEALNTERLFGVYRFRITCIVPPNSVVCVTLAFRVHYIDSYGVPQTDIMYVTIILINVNGLQVQGDTGLQPLMMYATKPE